MHRLLQRQLKRYLGDLEHLPQEWLNFIQAVDEAYCQFDGDRVMLERSLELSSQELLQANTQLQELLKTVEAQVAERTSELARANSELEETLTELRKTQMQLIQTEKMSSIGQLVAGVAHEINNPVNFIHGNLQYVRQYIHNLVSVLNLYQRCYPVPAAEIERQVTDLDLGFLLEDLPKLFTSMQRGSERIRQIVLSLRNFSRIDEAEIKAVDIHEGIESTLMLLQNRLKPRPNLDIQVIRQYGTLPQVECYTGQLNQVFMNILVNAIDALEESAGCDSTYSQNAAIADHNGQAQEHDEKKWGQITIQTSVLDSRWIKIAIADNGKGIPQSIQQRIFDPFFTTKPVGKGTGMGMSISYQIITEKHGGKLECFSSEGQGTEFVIQIPTHQQTTGI